MKKTILLAAVLLAFSGLRAQNKSIVSNGLFAIYTVYEEGSMSYNFIVKFTNISTDHVSAEYAFADGGRGDYGSIFIDTYALDSAVNLKNQYGTGILEFMGDETGVVASKLMFEKLSNGKNITIGMSGDGDVEFIPSGSFELSTTIRRSFTDSDSSFTVINDYGYTVAEGFKGISAESQDTKYSLVLLDNKNFPLILYMSTPEFEIRLNGVF